MSKLKIAIDARMCNESGIGRYIRNLIFHLQTIDKQNEYYILLMQNDFQDQNYPDNYHKVKANFSWYGFSEQIKLLRLLRGLKADLVHFPHFNVPYFYKGKFVVTIHDLIHQHFEMKRASTHSPFVYKIKHRGYKLIFENALKKSKKIFTPSWFVKKQILQSWNIADEKIVVTPEGVDDSGFEKISLFSQKQQENVLKKLNVRSPYIFYVGNAHPHKNVEGLIKVFLQLKDEYPDLSLVLSGYNHYFWQKIKKEYQSPGIVYTGYVTDEELAILYKYALVFVMPSFEEGFGIPILEAMANSCPVVSSCKGSLPEVGGDAAIYFDPQDNEDMKQKIDSVLSSNKLRTGLIKKGLARFEQFSWKNMAELTHRNYLQAVT